MKKEEIAWRILDARDTVAYITDRETYEVIFLSAAAMRLCNVTSEEEYKGKICYKLFHGLEEPCSFCTNNRLKRGEKIRWQVFNQYLQCWANAEDSLITLDGVEYRLEVLLDVSLEKEELEQKSRELEIEETLVRCIELLAYENDTSVAINSFLKTIGDFYGADRAYIIEYYRNRGTCSNTFEWCREGVDEELELLQEIPLEVVDKFNEKLETEGEFFISSLEEDLEEDSPDYQILKMQGIQSLAAVPFYQEKEITGFLGVDNPTVNVNDWTLLRSVSSFVKDELKMRRLGMELERASYMDTLTGLGNRNFYQKRLTELKEQKPSSIGIVFVDINGLKATNDRYGHNCGDALIVHTAQVLQNFFKQDVYRIGGDEFLVLCVDIPREEFQKKVSDMRRFYEQDQNCSVSIGSVWRDKEYILEDEVSLADELMYADKQRYYADVVQEGRRNRVGISRELLQEIGSGSFEVHFQPQYDLNTRTVVGVEALVRKKERGDKLILPANFIPRYEREGIIRHVDFFVLETVCKKLREWIPRGIELQASVNFSRVTLMEPHVVEAMLKVCEMYGVDPGRITVELTESISKLGNSTLKCLLFDLEQAGFRVALDDFGFAYANLALAAEHDFSEVKLDTSMIRELGKNRKMEIIVKNCLAGMGELGGIRVLAEGVESRLQYETLRKLDCKFGQGYYLARPMTAEMLEELILSRL